jgi:hypothetical protein
MRWIRQSELRIITIELVEQLSRYRPLLSNNACFPLFWKSRCREIEGSGSNNIIFLHYLAAMIELKFDPITALQYCCQS